ncbi:hypothetical protein [Rhodococcus sp. LW-XY12]|uniref:hypothetical protein n=1 Tax=Rhodococcus sp. LW-XY12 TaxID=2856851 RepID=UPI001C5A5961|nr:hypothetical protein [Rhodococcus sp. LW-XY12]QXU55208.1 hypothetical protein KXC42_08285 [Rhodococcus sp. LW-XY12]
MDLSDPEVKALVRRLEMLERDVAALHEAGQPPMPEQMASAVVRNATFEQAVDLLLDACPWVSDEHTPYVSALFKLARQIDGQQKPSSAAIMEFRMNVNDLRRCAPEDVEGKADPFDEQLAKILGS